MKKLIFLLAFTIGFAFTVCSQGSKVETITLASGVLYGNTEEHDTFFVYSPYLGEYWDYSIQFKSSFYGLGDSSSVRVETYRTNDPGQSSWVHYYIESDYDTLQTVTDDQSMLLEVSDFKGLWLQHQVLGMGYDTVTITPYVVKKLKRTIE